MLFIFHPEAETEFLETIEYYELCRNGLGYEFSIEIYSAIQKVIDYADAWPVLEGDIRRCLANRFPYGIIYSIENKDIYILAVMNLHRDPDYWMHRL
jgi:hypothetical protein